ncbi:putative auxin efflux carrier component 6-like [Capsicum annuum]|nr:putative auxin efflux carrier component 6-like [Capsicum annuum]
MNEEENSYDWSRLIVVQLRCFAWNKVVSCGIMHHLESRIESEKDLGDTAATAPVTSTDNEAKTKKKKKKGLLSRIWNSLFGSHKDDFEKRLQHISKEEAAVIARTVKRSHSWRRMSRHLIIISVLLELFWIYRGNAILWLEYAFLVAEILEKNGPLKTLPVVNSDEEVTKVQATRVAVRGGLLLIGVGWTVLATCEAGASLVIAVAYVIMTTRSLELNWKMRALRVLPMFLLPGLSFLTYSTLGSFTRMNEHKDQKTLERLRAERQAKIDELKEKTNYYITQHLIQRYDPDPASKAAAATVLASKLGADTGLKVYVGDESKLNAPIGKSNDVEILQSIGLGNRKQTRSGSADNGVLDHSEGGMLRDVQLEGSSMNQHQQMIVEHYNPIGLSTQDGGWLGRIAALLVGENPTQSYALICGSCHMHNGLARKEELPYITYYCPHYKALNRPKQLTDGTSSSSTLNMASTTIALMLIWSNRTLDPWLRESPQVAALQLLLRKQQKVTI